jgi:hypothetical protein
MSGRKQQENAAVKTRAWNLTTWRFQIEQKILI